MNNAHSKSFALPVLLFIAGMAFMRPMILGYFSSTIGLVLLTSCVLATLIYIARDGRIERRFLHLFLLSLGVGVIMTLVLAPGLGFKIAVTSFILTLVSVASCFVIVGVFPLQTFSYVRLFLRFVVFSNFATLILAGFDVNQLSTLAYLTFPMSGHGIIEEFSILFPLSTIPFRMTNDLFILPRSTFLSIEPGTGVLIVFLWRFLEKSHASKHAVLFNIVFVLALMSTASTTAPLMIGCYFAIPRLFEGRPIVSVRQGGIEVRMKLLLVSLFLFLCTVYLLFYAPYFGIIDKSATHGDSFQDRIATYSGAKGSALHRYITVALLIAVYYVVKRFIIKRSFLGVYAALFVVSLLNVAAFSLLFWLTLYLVLVIAMRDEVVMRSQ